MSTGTNIATNPVIAGINVNVAIPTRHSLGGFITQLPIPKPAGTRAIHAIKWPARHRVFFGTALWVGFPGRAVEANGEAVGTTVFLFAFGFFFSRLRLFWPFATVSSYDDAGSCATCQRCFLAGTQ